MTSIYILNENGMFYITEDRKLKKNFFNNCIFLFRYNEIVFISKGNKISKGLLK